MSPPDPEDDLQTFVGTTRPATDSDGDVTALGAAADLATFAGATTPGTEASVPAGSPGRPATIGRYRILRLIGEGGRDAEAEAPLRDLSEAVVRTSPDLWERFNLGSMRGASLVGQRRFEETEPLLVGGYEGMATRKPTANPNFRSRFTLREAGEAILQMYADWGNPSKRAEWAARLKK